MLIVSDPLHRSYLSHLRWGHGGLSGRLITASYDGAVRALDAEKGVFTEIFASVGRSRLTQGCLLVDSRFTPG